MLNIPEEVKQLFRKGSAKKNLHIHFPNGEREDITNRNIILESFSFEESICSQENLKFGLCEASMVEFETIGVENIKGCEIEVFHEIDISSLSEDFIAEHGTVTEDVPFPYYRIPYGRFTVDTCPRQSDMSRRKVTAYTQEFLFEKISEIEIEKRKEIAYSHASRKYYDYDLFKFIASNYFLGNEQILKKSEVETKEFGLGMEVNDLGGGYSWTSRFKVKRYLIDTEEKLKSLYYINNDFNKNGLLKKLRGELEEKVTEWAELYYSGYYDKNYAINKVLQRAYPTINDSSPYNGIKISDDSKLVYMYPYGYDIDFSDTDAGIYLPYACEIILLKNAVNEVEKVTVELLPNTEIYLIDTSQWKEFIVTETGNFVDSHIDFRKTTEAYVELMGMFGRAGRNGEFDFISLNNTLGLYPSEMLYPSDDLYPVAIENLLTKSMYKSAWYDDEYTRLYSKVTCTYKDSETEEDTYAEHIIVDVEDGEVDKYQTYDISDNYLIKENTFTEAQISEILANIASNIDRIRYMPADIDLRGLPYIEAGDVVQVLTTDGGFETIVLRRTLAGIQSLTDNFESRG